MGGYEQIRWLTTGGMAEIYLARRPGIGDVEKECVVKRMRPEYRDEQQFVDMFLDEADLAASFRHQNLPHVFEVGVDDSGLPFYAMEYLEGADCHQLAKLARARGGSLPREHAVQIAIGAAAGLHYAHFVAEANGAPLRIVHRDVSPANIFVTVDGGVKVVDFGVAQADQRRTQTVDGALKGKVAYMSPEQVSGARLDHRSDIFSLGVVLYELTVGARPFDSDGTDLETLKRVASGVYTPPSVAAVGYPEALEVIVERAMQREPEQRFPSADAMAEALEQFAAEEGMVLSPRRLGRYVCSLASGPCSPLDRTAIRSTIPELDVALGAGTATDELGVGVAADADTVRTPPPMQDPGPQSHVRRLVLGFVLGAGLVLALLALGVLPWFRDAAPSQPTVEQPGEAGAAAPATEQDAAVERAEEASPKRGAEAPADAHRTRSKSTARRHRRPAGAKSSKRAGRAKKPDAKGSDESKWREDSPFPPVRDNE